ncbi:MAG: SufD family Fe-S cluster assembly protein, partial [Candidatus Nanopelagicales bacterium]
MSATTTPRSDLAPRVISNDPALHEVPNGREEEWRFTPIKQIADFFQQQDWSTIGASEAPFVQVRPADQLSEVEATAGWRAIDLPSALARSQASQVVSIAIPAEHESDEVIVVDLTAAQGGNYGRVEIAAGAFSKATIVLRHDMTADASGIIVTTVGDQADLTVLNMYDGPRTSRHVWQWATTVGRDARFLGLSITLGGAFVRLVPSVRYAGPGGSAQMLGAFLATDEQFQEFRLFVDHNEPHCTS